MKDFFEGVIAIVLAGAVLGMVLLMAWTIFEEGKRIIKNPCMMKYNHIEDLIKTELTCGDGDIDFSTMEFCAENGKCIQLLDKRCIN